MGLECFYKSESQYHKVTIVNIFKRVITMDDNGDACPRKKGLLTTSNKTIILKFEFF